MPILISVQSDGETWEDVNETSLVFEADEEIFDRLQAGEVPKDFTEDELKRMKAVSLLELYEFYKANKGNYDELQRHSEQEA